MKSFLGVVLKLLGIFVLAAVALGIVLVAAGVFSWGHYEASQAAKRAKKNAAIEVVRMYASPPNRTLAWRFYLVKNTSGKTITALKFMVTVFNKLHEKVDQATIAVTKPIAANAEAYCDIYTVFDAESGLPTDNGIYVDPTDKRLVDFAEHEAGCKPEDLRVNYAYKVKVLAIAYAH